MPRPLIDDLARAHAEDRMRANMEHARNAKRADRAGMRDITKGATESPAMPGDRTHNGADARKSRRLTDRLESHVTATAHVIGDTTIMQDATVREVRRTPSRMIVRNADGTTNVQDTLAVLTRWRLFNASRYKDGR